MKTDKGSQCDSCSKMAEPGDQFFQFVIPMVAAASNPRVPAPLVCCPSCKDKVKKAMAEHDPSYLPPGRLKRVLERLKSKEIMKRLKLY